MSSAEFVIFGVLVGALWQFIHLYRTLFSKKTQHKPPPGPPGLPLIGHFHMLGKLPHRTLYKLSQKYGPIMSIRLGPVPTVIVSSPAAAELFFKTHDSVFASRPTSQAADYLFYGTKGIGFTKYGAYWRNARKFCTLELLNAEKVKSMAGMRREDMMLLVESLKQAAAASEVVDISDKACHLIEAMTCRMLFGKSRDEKIDLSAIVHHMAEDLGAFNISDYIPFLRPLNLQGLTRRFKVTSEAVDKILETIIDDHEKDAANGYKKNDRDFVDIILASKMDPVGTHEQLARNIDRSHIKAIVLDLIFGAIDASPTAIEWTMSELIRHPRVMKRLQEEIKNITEDCEFVEESHLSNLEYLDMVIKESMRLHPVTPIIAPHESMEDIVIDGYHIPKKSRIIVNSWALGQDPRFWSENVQEFVPERFEGSNIDLLGQSFHILPFSSGRRGCPGKHWGLLTIKLVVAQLVHSFDWELPLGISPHELPMDEGFGLCVPRASHLLAIPRIHLP
ncbi:hypothetical protein ACET3Z_011726 [Daucus carota]